MIEKFLRVFPGQLALASQTFFVFHSETRKEKTKNKKENET